MPAPPSATDVTGRRSRRIPAWFSWPAVLRRHGSDPVVASAALAQVATILLTWPLWTSRAQPPTLPLTAPLDQPGYGALLLITAGLAVVRPRAAGPAHCVILLAACLGDQTRVQPEVVSLALLLTAPAFGPGGRQIARWYLASLWLWSGLHKALSLGWASGQAGMVAADLGRPTLARTVARLVPTAEILLGLSALVPRARPVTRWGGALVHLGILVWLSPVAGDRNIAVWPWNAALVVASLCLFAPDEERWTTGPRAVRWGAVAVLLVGPGLHYWRGDNAYLSHHLYSAGAPTAIVCGPGGCDHEFFATDGTRVPFPPEPRLYRQRFEDWCEPGTTLVVTVPENRLQGARVEEVDCPRTST